MRRRAQSIGLYAAGLTVRHGAEVVDYVDHRPERLDIAEKLGAQAHFTASKGKLRPADIPRTDYDIAVEGTSSAIGVELALRSLAPGGICQPVGYYLRAGTRVPLMHMYANDATLKIGVSNVRSILPDVLDFVARQIFPLKQSPPSPPTGKTPPMPTRRTPPSWSCTASPCTPPGQAETRHRCPLAEPDFAA
ncbi:zinc-binding dehydrogenase [Nocardia sp. NPDC057455]|uniref:zinc-binding dehydrogenase n=1 Tax=Nocardia sp. NPDC057455 TaxID=3346138 RepID=UPI00366DA5DE